MHPGGDALKGPIVVNEDQLRDRLA